MREFDAFAGYPDPTEPRIVSPTLRTIQNRIVASYRDKEFYDGDRANGYGGMKDDGRWAPIAKNLVEHYGLKEGDWVLQINSHKGYLLRELASLGMNVRGAEPSEYARQQSVVDGIKGNTFTFYPGRKKSFDLVIAASAVYAGNLEHAIRVLKNITRVCRGSAWITLAAYEDENDIEGLMLLRYWFITGTLILTKAEWRIVMEHAGYTGDFRYDTAKSLNLVRG